MTILRKGNRLRHQNSLDLDIVLCSDILFADKDGYAEVYVRYFNRTYGIFVDPNPERVRINENDLPKWKLIGGLS